MQQGDDHKTMGKYAAWEYALLALTVWRESRNQGEQGMKAVAWSIRNRVYTKDGKAKWWGKDWEEVVLKRWQYTANMPQDPNAVLLPGDPAQDKVWDTCLRVCEDVYLGIGIDPTQGATHYYAPKVVSEPAWVKAVGTVYRGQIGDHLFYTAS